jgi:quercetin dioxygenase-like cupin family protein
MLEGTLETQVQGGELQRVTKGQIFTENPDDIHVLMRNVSATEPARFLVFYIKKAGAPAGRLVEKASE